MVFPGNGTRQFVGELQDWHPSGQFKWELLSKIINPAIPN